MKAAFALTEVETLQRIIRDHPLAAIVSSGDAGLGVNHIPLHLRGDTLVGHVARNNRLVQRHGSDVLAIFSAADGYVSPGWYPSKAEHGRAVPTWNYVVAHAHGRLRVIDDAGWIRQQLDELTASQEAGRPHPWKVSDAPADYIEKMLGAIVGIEIPIERLEGTHKASQNRDARDRAAVKEAFALEPSESARAICRWM